MEKFIHLFEMDPGMYKHQPGGIWMPSVLNSKTLEASSSFVLRDTDIFSPTYPKTGELGPTVLFKYALNMNGSYLKHVQSAPVNSTTGKTTNPFNSTISSGHTLCVKATLNLTLYRIRPKLCVYFWSN